MSKYFMVLNTIHTIFTHGRHGHVWQLAQVP